MNSETKNEVIIAHVQVLYRKYNATKIFKPERYKMQNMTKT
jgi:hypothetical protein